MSENGVSKEKANGFYQTEYWKDISQKVRQHYKFTCQKCGKHGVQVHHKTYEHFGKEHIHWREDLILLCEECHRREHDIFIKSEGRAPLASYNLTDVLDYLYQKKVDWEMIEEYGDECDQNEEPDAQEENDRSPNLGLRTGDELII